MDSIVTGPAAATRRRLLDSAEKLFSIHGYDGTSVRSITAAAGCRTASINEEFGGKIELYRHVLLRRIKPLNKARFDALALIDPAGERRNVLHDVVRAFVDPMRRFFLSDSAWIYYFRLSSQISHSARSSLVLVMDEYNEVAERFVGFLSAAFPDLDRTRAYEGYLLMVASANAVFSDDMRLGILTSSIDSSAAMSARYMSLVAFVDSGLWRLFHGVDD